VWLQCQLNAMLRTDAVLRTLGPDWRTQTPFAIGTELFRRVLDHPEGMEMARISEATNLDDHVNFDDKRIRLAPPAILDEVRRAIDTPPARDPRYPFVLAAGLRTHWTANTIQRDPKWRKGRGPHCAINLSRGDALRLGVQGGDPVRVSTRRGSLVLPAQIDGKLRDGHVWMPNGFGMMYPSGDGSLARTGANQNELTDTADRDPFTGIPHHRYVLCQIERVGD